MKKIIAIIMASTFALASVTAAVSVTYATDNHIPGFTENMDGLFLRNQQAELEQVMRENLGEFLKDRFYNSYLPGTKALGKTDGKTDEELYASYMAQGAVNFALGFKYYGLHTNHYMAQYVADGSFEYLIDDSAYLWLVPTTGKILSGIPFYSDGTIVTRVPSGLSLFLDEEILNFLFDYDKVEKLLQDVGEPRVNDIKIITQPLSMLYINGEQDDYMIRLERYVYDVERNQTFAGVFGKLKVVLSHVSWNALNFPSKESWF